MIDRLLTVASCVLAITLANVSISGVFQVKAMGCSSWVARVKALAYLVTLCTNVTCKTHQTTQQIGLVT